eukprot:757246-Hanusia_phi.AAC.4
MSYVGERAQVEREMERGVYKGKELKKKGCRACHEREEKLKKGHVKEKEGGGGYGEKGRRKKREGGATGRRGGGRSDERGFAGGRNKLRGRRRGINCCLHLTWRPYRQWAFTHYNGYETARQVVHAK